MCLCFDFPNFSVCTCICVCAHAFVCVYMHLCVHVHSQNQTWPHFTWGQTEFMLIIFSSYCLLQCCPLLCPSPTCPRCFYVPPSISSSSHFYPIPRPFKFFCHSNPDALSSTSIYIQTLQSLFPWYWTVLLLPQLIAQDKLNVPRHLLLQEPLPLPLKPSSPPSKKSFVSQTFPTNSNSETPNHDPR